jgi:hypothetical protein
MVNKRLVISSAFGVQSSEPEEITPMGWRFISQKQKDETTKVKDHDIVRFITDPQTRQSDAVDRKFGPDAIVNGVAAFLEKHAEGLSKQDLTNLEARLHATIRRVLRWRD